MVPYTNYSIAKLVWKHCVLSIHQCWMKINTVTDVIFQEEKDVVYLLHAGDQLATHFNSNQTRSPWHASKRSHDSISHCYKIQMTTDSRRVSKVKSQLPWFLTVWPFLTLHARVSFLSLCSWSYKVLINIKLCLIKGSKECL